MLNLYLTERLVRGQIGGSSDRETDEKGETETGERTDRSNKSVSDQRQSCGLPVDMACIPASANTKQLGKTQIHHHIKSPVNQTVISSDSLSDNF